MGKAFIPVVRGETPRSVAARLLLRRARTRSFTENLLDQEPAVSRLSPADRALCRELVSGCIRWESTLDWLIARKTDSRAQKAALQVLLRLGLYQLLWLDRVPAHAAVHETVQLARELGFGPQSGFVNAVLRNYVREKDATRRLLDSLKVDQPALGWSHPEWLVTRWHQRWGTDSTSQLLEWNNTPPNTFARVNTAKTDPGRLLDAWREENVEYDFSRHDWMPENLVFELKAHPPLAGLTSFRQGWFYVQDPSTLLAVHLLDPQPGETVLDLCAAPGGKASYMAQSMRNEGRVVACDTSEKRLSRLAENCRRLGVTCVETVHFIGQQRVEVESQQFDRVLVDVPCSNTGVMRRRVDLRWRITPQEISRLAKVQRELLQNTARLVKPGGTLVYSTCSLEPEENSGVVTQFLSACPSFEKEAERELFPFRERVDGAYVARLRHRL